MRGDPLVRAVLLLALVAGPACRAEDPPEALRGAASAVASEEAEIEHPPPLPSLAPFQAALTPDEARRLALNLAPRTSLPEFADFRSALGSSLGDALFDVCGATVPTVGEDVTGFLQRSLLGSDSSRDHPSQGLGFTTIVLPARAAAGTAFRTVVTAVRSCRSAESSVGVRQAVEERPDLRPAEVEPAESIAFTQSFSGGPFDFVATTLVVRAGPVLFVAYGDGPDRTTADLRARRVWTWAAGRIRRSGLLP